MNSVEILNSIKEGEETLSFENLILESLLSVESSVVTSDIFYKEIVKICCETTSYGKIAQFISDFISRNGESLGSKNPAKYINYTETDEANLLEILNVDSIHIKKLIKESTVIKNEWKIATDVMNLVLTVFIYYYYYNKEKFTNFSYPPYKYICLFFTLKFYSSLQRRQFKYQADEGVMEATIDNLNKKWILSKIECMFDVMVHYADTNVEYTKDTLFKTPSDNNIVAFIMKLKTRLSSFIVNVSKEYYKNHADNMRITTGKDVIELEDNKTVLAVQSNVSNDIAIVTQRIVHSFISNGADTEIIQIACEKHHASFNNLWSVMNSIRSSSIENNDESYIEMIGCFISYFLVTEKRERGEIRSEFFRDCLLNIYQVSNTNDEYILKIKTLINDLLEKHSKEYSSGVMGKSTRNNIRAAIYTYTVYYILKYCE